MKTRIKIAVVAATVAAFSALGLATPAQAWTCDESIEDACRTAATVICGVVAKGRPCIY